MDDHFEERMQYIDSVVADTRERWKHLLTSGTVTQQQFDDAMEEVKDTLLLHPVAMEYVSRAMPRRAAAKTEERGAQDTHLDAAVGDDV